MKYNQKDIDPDPNDAAEAASNLSNFDGDIEINMSSSRTVNVVTAQSTREYTEVHETPVTAEINSNQSSTLPTIIKSDRKVSFNPTIILSYPVIVDYSSMTGTETKQAAPTPNVKPMAAKTPPLQSIPALSPYTNKNTQTGTVISICPRCGTKIDACETKMVPTQKAWFVFICLFCFGCFFISWIPFLCKRCYDPVDVCPHCFRRLRRPPVGSN